MKYKIAIGLMIVLMLLIALNLAKTNEIYQEVQTTNKELTERVAQNRAYVDTLIKEIDDANETIEGYKIYDAEKLQWAWDNKDLKGADE